MSRMNLQSVLERSLKTIAVTKAEFILKKTQHCHHAAIVSCKNNSELIRLMKFSIIATLALPMEKSQTPLARNTIFSFGTPRFHRSAVCIVMALFTKLILSLILLRYKMILLFVILLKLQFVR